MMNYTKSKYNFFFDYNSKNYIYNTLSTALVELDNDIYVNLKTNKIENIKQDYINLLREMHFIVDKDISEAEEFSYYFDSIRYGQSSNVLSITLIPSYNCNLACPYCMQGQDKSVDTMNEDSLFATLKFMENYLNNNKNVSKLAISLFGGEPMLNKAIIFDFCDKANEIAEKYHCETFFSMTSNMTLLDEKMIEYMRKYQIHTQVSIDGTREQHNQKRIYKNGKGTYDLIVSNLEKLYEAGLKNLVTIRLNIDSSNIDNSESIMSSFIKYSDDVYFGFIDTFKGANDNFENCIPEESYPGYVTEKFSKCYKKFGFPVPKLFGKKAPCSMNSKGKFFIDNKLNVYKCEMVLRREDAKVGTLSMDGNFLPNASFFNQMTFSPMLDEKCRDCILLPMCGGGCPAKKYIDKGSKDGDFHLFNCMFSENSLLMYLKNYIDNGD